MTKPFKIEYDRRESKEFIEVFQRRVKDYFKANDLSMYGDWRIRIKIIILFTIFFTSYFLMYAKGNTPGMVLLFGSIFGLTSIMIGLNIIHDACHNALFRKTKWNKLLLYSMNMLGSSGYLYHLNHAKIHHNFPNVIGIDADLNQGIPFLRVSPGAPKFKFHKYQHIYAPLVYMFYTLFLIYVKDFTDFRFFHKKDSPLLNVQHPRKEYFIFLLSKIFYLTYALVLPLMFLNIVWWKVLLGYLFINILMSILAVGVQVLIHTNDKAHFIELDQDGSIHRNWAVHTIMNTTDIMAENKNVTFLLGGLNTHSVHHLMPGICHIHYVNLTKILRETTQEFGLEYTNFTFLESLRSHYVFLKQLGKYSV